MNYAAIWQLMVKDWYLQRWSISGSFAGAVVALALVALGGKTGFWFGVLLLCTVLIAIGAQVAVGSMVNERKEQTLAFVMSLPISYQEYTTAKLVGNLLVFLAPWTLCMLGSFALLLYPPATSIGLIPYTAIMGMELLVSTCAMAAVAITTESQTWTIVVLMVGNVGLNAVGYWVGHIPDIAKTMFGSRLLWTPSAIAFLAGEFVVIALLISAAFFVQSRKRDFL